MEIQALRMKTRSTGGKGAARAARRAGNVPAVLYGLGAGPAHLEVDARVFDVLLQGKQGEHAIVNLEVEDQPDLSCPAMIKEVQHHPVHDEVIHADLLRIDLTKKIHTLVPIKIEGQSAGVIEGGVLDNQTREVEVSCLATEVPEFLACDISELEIGMSLHVSDLTIPEGVELLTDPGRSLVAVQAPRVIEEVVVEGEEGVEGELAEGAEGAEGEEGATEGEGEEAKADK